MTDGWVGGDLARESNDRFAASYDEFNRGYMYVQWTAKLLGCAEEAVGSFASRRLLDLGCGTGLSFLPMLDRGWEVVACDVSPEMVERADEKASGRAEVRVADMRELPADLGGNFDLVWAVNDALNYLLSEDELLVVLRGMRASLRPGGVVLFDVNTLDTYRTFFAEELVREGHGRRLIWTGEADSAQAHPGMIAEATFKDEGVPSLIHVHRQRHFPESMLRGAIESAGMRPVAVYGELEGELDQELDEERHSKAVFVCQSS